MKSKALRLSAFSITTVFLMTTALTACTPALPPPPATKPDDGDRKRRRDPEKPKYGDRRAGGCGKDRKCEEICDDIFRSRRDREACEEYSIADVEKMDEVFEVLERPNSDDLEDLDTESLDMMLDISPKPLETAVGRMNQSEKKKFLAWLATDSEATEIIESAEDDFAIIKELFGTTQSAIIAELNRNIDSGDTFVEIILTEGNDVALEWLHDFFGDQCDNDNNYEKCVFKNYYCRLNLDSDAEDEYFGFDSFESVLDEVLETERKTSGAPSWWDTNTEARDLDSWQSSPHNVCTNMKP